MSRVIPRSAIEACDKEIISAINSMVPAISELSTEIAGIIEKIKMLDNFWNTKNGTVTKQDLLNAAHDTETAISDITSCREEITSNYKLCISELPRRGISYDKPVESDGE